jgi:capsular polysaccharide biosynthesis protein
MWHVVLKHWKLVFLWAFLIAFVSGGVSWLFPKQYSAESRVIIISRDKSGIDPYTQAKAAERIGEGLSQVMKTTDFYNKVGESAPEIFSQAEWQRLNDRDQRKKWQKDVQGEMVYGTSLLKIVSYGSVQEKALALSQAVSKTLVAHGWEYVGGEVAIKEVDSALVSRLPARPNFLINMGVGFVVGGLLAALWVTRYRGGR